MRYGLRLINPRKVTGPDFTSLIKFTSNVIFSHFYNTTIKDLEKSKFLGEPKIPLVTLIFKKNGRNKIGSYRPISIVNEMSKIYERCIHNNLTSYAETISNFKSANK